MSNQPATTAAPATMAPRPMGECAECHRPMDDPYDDRHTLPNGLDVHPECCPCQTEH